jgi:CRP-like cAMP-binding protein
MNGNSQADTLFRTFGKNVPAKTVIFREGEPGNDMFIIQEGQVRISRKAGDVEKTLSDLAGGEFFGEMSLLNNELRSATASTTIDSKILVINRNAFTLMIKNSPDFALRLISRLSERLRQADHQISDLLALDKKGRVVSRLVMLIRAAEKAGNQADALALRNVTRELSGQAGLKPEEVSTILLELKDTGIIGITGAQQIQVNDLEKFQKLAAFYAPAGRQGAGS